MFVCRYAFAVLQLRGRSFNRNDTWFQSDLEANCNEFDFDMEDIKRLREEIRQLIQRLSELYVEWKQEQKEQARIAKEERKARKLRARQKKSAEPVASDEADGQADEKLTGSTEEDPGYDSKRDLNSEDDDPQIKLDGNSQTEIDMSKEGECSGVANKDDYVEAMEDNSQEADALTERHGSFASDGVEVLTNSMPQPTKVELSAEHQDSDCEKGTFAHPGKTFSHPGQEFAQEELARSKESPAPRHIDFDSSPDKRSLMTYRFGTPHPNKQPHPGIDVLLAEGSEKENEEGIRSTVDSAAKPVAPMDETAVGRLAPIHHENQVDHI